MKREGEQALCIYLPKKVNEKFGKICRELETNKSSQIRLAIKKFIKDYEGKFPLGFK